MKLILLRLERISKLEFSVCQNYSKAVDHKSGVF